MGPVRLAPAPHQADAAADAAPLTSAEAGAAPGAGPHVPADALVEDELLVEEISIDGMCGVY